MGNAYYQGKTTSASADDAINAGAFDTTKIALQKIQSAAASGSVDFYKGMDISFLGTGISRKILEYSGSQEVEVHFDRLDSGLSIPSGTEYVIQTTHNNLDIGSHAYTECSSKGKCDHTTGQCQCYAGYTGKGCRRQSCPNKCSGHGRCMTNAEVNEKYSPYGEDLRVNELQAQIWDYNKTRQCVCDPGYEGYDCSGRICPRGDDPLTDCDNREGSSDFASEVPHIQELTFAQVKDVNAGYFVLNFEDKNHKTYTTKPILLHSTENLDPSAPSAADLALLDETARQIQEALMELPNFVIPNVRVSHNNHQDQNGQGTLHNKYYVTFSDPANSGVQNLLTCSETSHEENLNNYPGSQPRFMNAQMKKHTANQVVCTATSETPYLKFDNDNKVRYTENIECSGRGQCDSTSGLCQCYDGFTGEACATQTVFF